MADTAIAVEQDHIKNKVLEHQEKNSNGKSVKIEFASSTGSSDIILSSSNMESLSINQHSSQSLDSGDDFTSTSDTQSNSSYSSMSNSTGIGHPHLSNSTPQSSPQSVRSTPLQQQPLQHSQVTSVAAASTPTTPTSPKPISAAKPFPLHEAAFKGQYENLVSLLLFTQGKKAPNSPQPSRHQTPNSPGGGNHDHSTAPTSITTANVDQFVGVNALDDKKTTALHHAAFNGHKQCVKLLLASGAFPDVADADGCTPLHNAAFNGYKSVMSLLMEAGANVNASDIDGNSALHKTTYSGFHKCAELLLAAGAKVDLRDSYGITPLLKAASNKHYKCLTLLIEKGADVNTRDSSDSTALHQSCYKGSDRAITLLIQKGANVNSVDKEGYTPLHNAVFNGFEECSRLLLDKGANVDQQALDGCTPLHYAASNGFESCVSLLIRRNCKLDIKDVKRGRTALHYAANKGNLVCVELLIKAGADINVKDVTGKTPKNLTKNSDIISLLNISLDDKKKTSKLKTRPKRNTDSEVIKSENSNNNNGLNHSISQSQSKSFSSDTSSLANSQSLSSVHGKQKWDVAVDNTTSPTSISMNKQHADSLSNSTSSTTTLTNSTTATTTTTTTTNHANSVVSPLSQSSPNGSISRSGSSDSMCGENQSPEMTPKLDIYGFVKTTSTVDREETVSIRTKKNEKWEKKWAKISKNWTKYSKSTKLREYLAKGIPSSLRAFVWQRLVNIQEIKNRLCPTVTYQELLQRPVNPNIAAQIQRDLNRTFPKHSFFVEKGGFGQQILCNILTAYAVYNPVVGYCQGMGFITCLLIIYMAEEDAFWVLVQLAEKYGMSEIWKPEFPYLQTCFGILDTLLVAHFPQLQAHIKKQNVFTPLYAPQWFICLLIYNLPFPVIVRIWDLFLYEGLIVIFAAVMALFKTYEDQILKSEFEEILSILKFGNGEEKTLRIDISSFMKLLVHYKHKIKHSAIKDPQEATTSTNNNNNHK